MQTSELNHRNQLATVVVLTVIINNIIFSVIDSLGISCSNNCFLIVSATAFGCASGCLLLHYVAVCHCECMVWVWWLISYV